MKNYKIGIGLILGIMATMPFVAADLISPVSLAIPVVGLVLVVGFIVGAVFLIRWIIRKIKNKQ